MENTIGYLDRASGAMMRRDWLSAIQFAMLAKWRSQPGESTRCDAYMVLALTSMEIGMEEEALAWAVGAHLAASWTHDAIREAQASSILTMVMSQFPHLQQRTADHAFH